MNINEIPVGQDGAVIVEDSLEPHPVSLIMPPMPEEEFVKFKSDIQGQGLIDPIILFQGKILDGNNRYRACKELKIDVWARKWEGGMDPVEYVVSKNLYRRQLTPAQRATAAAKAIHYWSEEAKERQKEHGGTAPGKTKSLVEPVPLVSGKARDKAGKAFGVSGRSVEGAKYVLDHGTAEEVTAIETGKAKVKPTEQKVREREKNKPKPKALFNATTDSIEWAKWTWNPVTGCKHGCPYCYARDIANHYPAGFPKGFEPTFHPDRLSAPSNTSVPKTKSPGSRNVFVCSMADLFGDWVPRDWIDKVIVACRNAPQWTFIFLTKNPKRLVEVDWPENAWVGTTVDTQERVEAAVDAFRAMKDKEDEDETGEYNAPTVSFVSCEPLLDGIDFGEDSLFGNNLALFDWVIIGGQSPSSGAPATQPEWEWVEELHIQARQAGCSVYWKPNLTVRPKEYPE